MAESNIIQMHDYEGNNQYPVTLASLVYDEDGETVGKKLALLLDWFEWGDDKQTSVKTKYNFFSEQQVSAGGIGEEGEGGEGGIGTITGIKVNGEVWNEPDEMGLLTLPDYPTSLEWTNINGRPENLSEFNNDKGYITEVTEDMIIDATEAIPNAGKVLISTGGGLGWVLHPRKLSDLTDDVVAGHYLPLTGGTMGNTTVYELYTDVWSIGGNPYTLTISRAGSWASSLICVKNTHNSENDYAEIGAYGNEGTINTFYFALKNQGYSQAALRITEYVLYHKDYPILHSANYATEIGDYYLKSSGGILGDSWSGGTEIRRKDSNNGHASLIFSQADGTILGRFGFGGVDRPIFVTQSGAYNPLLHSGNVGDYAVIKSTAIDLSQTNLNVVGYGISTSGWFINGPAIAIGHPNGYTMLLQQHTDDNRIYVNRKNPNGIAGDWQQLAFTDSTVAGADALKDDAGNSIVYYRENVMLYIGDVIYANASTKILGKNIYLAYGESATNGLILNSYGNVTIGLADFAGTEWKSFVAGNSFVYGYGTRPELGQKPESSFSVGYHANGRVLFGLHTWVESSGDALMQVGRSDGTAKAYNLILNPLGGNVSIGDTRFDSGAKLQVATTFRDTLPSLGSLGPGSDFAIQYTSTYACFGLYFSLDAQLGNTTIQSGRSDGGTAAYALLLNPLGGNVGIGTTDPKEKLHIGGAARANQIKIIDKADTFYPLTIYNDWYGDTGVKYSLIRLLSSTDNARGGFIRVGIEGTYGRFHSMNFGSVDSSYVTMLHLNASGYVGIGTESPDEMLHVAGNIRLKNDNDFGCFLKFGDSNYCYLYEDTDDHLKIYSRAGILLSTDVGYGVTIDRTLTIGSAVLSWDNVNNALKIEGNVYTTGQLSAGGVGTEVQKVFDINAESNATTANLPYTKTLTHNLNTYDLAVVVYEVEEITQSDGITEKLTQVLADVTLTDENNVEVYFATRKINKKYRIVIIG